MCIKEVEKKRKKRGKKEKRLKGCREGLVHSLGYFKCLESFVEDVVLCEGIHQGSRALAASATIRQVQIGEPSCILLQEVGQCDESFILK